MKPQTAPDQKRIQPPHDARPRRSLHSPQEQQNASSAQASCAAAARHCLRPAKKAARRPFCRRQAARLHAKCAPRMQKRRTRRLPAASERAFSLNAARRGDSSLPAPRTCRITARASHQPHRNAPSAQASCAAAARHCLRPAKKTARRPFCKRQAACEVRPAHAESPHAPVTSRIGRGFSASVLRRGGSSLPASRKKGCAPACEVRPRMQKRRTRRLPAASDAPSA